MSPPAPPPPSIKIIPEPPGKPLLYSGFEEMLVYWGMGCVSIQHFINHSMKLSITLW